MKLILLSIFPLLLTVLVLNAQSSAPDFAALRHAWIQALETRNLEASLATYDPQATFINPDGTHPRGAGIRNLFEMVFASLHAKISMNPRTTDFSRNLAYDSGSYDEVIEDVKTGSQHRTSGDYLTIYRRNGQGKWLIVQQVWTEVVAATH